MAATSQTPDKTYLPFRGVLNDPSLYSALDPSSRQIRCVDLHPGSSTDLVVCSLVYTTLDPEAGDLPSYEALSYCWGSVNDTVAIHLRSPNMDTGWLHRHQDGPDGAEANPSVGNFQVTRNLEAALRAHRRPNQTRRLWVDAICINQMSDKEKTHQVGHMNLIYKLAEHVLVWLGEADIWSKFVFRCHHLLEAEHRAFLGPSYLPSKTLRTAFEDTQVGNNMQRIHDAFWRAMTRDEVAGKLSDILATQELNNDLDFKMLQPPFNEETMQQIFGRSLDRFFDRPWFHRIWVYPEVLLAQVDSNNDPQVTIIVEASIMRWSHLLQLFKPAYDSRVSFPKKNIGWFRYAWFQQILTRYDEMTLRNYCGWTEEFLASDPRDKVFALLHVAKDTRDRIHTDSRLLPDYEKSTLDIALDYSGAGVRLAATIRTVEPIVTNTTLATKTFDFDFWFSGFGIIPPICDKFPLTCDHSHEYPFRGVIVACVKEHTGSPRYSDQAPTGHDCFFVTTDERLFSSNYFAISGCLVVSSPGRPETFLIYPESNRYDDGLLWKFFGICSPHPPPSSS
jgi:hypothetical protein